LRAFRLANTVSILLFIGVTGWAQSHTQSTDIKPTHAALEPRCAAAPISSNGDASQLKKDEIRLLAILASEPDNAGALAGMGWVRSRQKNYLAAVGYLERAKQQRAGDRSLSVALDLDRFRFVLGEADYALSSNELTSAEKFYALAIEIRPHDRAARVGLRSTLLRQQKSLALANKPMR
jgi:tetratricopeptide (TPR) repeat protein